MRKTFTQHIQGVLGQLLAGNRQAARIAQVGKSLTVVEDWMERNLSEQFVEGRSEEFLGAVIRGSKLVYRLAERVNVRHSQDVEDDLLRCGLDLLALKYVLAAAGGFAPEARVVREMESEYPDLAELVWMDENVLVIRLEEAINRIHHIYLEYPY